MKYKEVVPNRVNPEWWFVMFEGARGKKQGFGFASEEDAKNALAMARWARKHKVKLQ